MRINIARSQTWMSDDISCIGDILEETINDFVEEGDRIINIETKEFNGLKRFWIYIEKNN